LQHGMTFLQSLADDVFLQSRHIDALHTALNRAQNVVRFLADKQEMCADRRFLDELEEFVSCLFVHAFRQP
jgi:hypothetical protein